MSDQVRSASDDDAIGGVSTKPGGFGVRGMDDVKIERFQTLRQGL